MLDVLVPMLRLLALLAAALTLVAADAAGEARLRPHVTVQGPAITLGDLFDDAGPHGAIEVGPAPAPGRRAVYTVPQVAAVARAHGLEWSGSAQVSQIEVVRASRPVGRPEIAEAVRAALRDQGLGSDYNIEIGNRQLDIQAPAGDPVSLGVEALNYDRRTRRFDAVLVVSAGQWSERVRLAGRAHRFLELPVLARAVAAGEVVREEDLEWVEVRADRLTRQSATSPEQIVGLAARRSLRPGAPLRLGDFAPPVVVAKGKLVTMTVVAPGMTLSATGRALEDGADGEAIMVMNVQSKRTVQAVVVGPDEVRIPHRSQLAAAARSDGGIAR